MLLFNEESPAFSRVSDAPGLPATDPNRYPKRNLRDLVTTQHVFNPPSSEPEQEEPFKHPERRALAAKLALNLFIFCGWQHTSKPWDGSGVYFLSSSQRDYDRDSPYISCLVNQKSSGEFRAGDDDAPIQCFTEFAKLLLELEYGPLPDTDFSQASDFGWFAIREFHESMQDYGELSKAKYLEAVGACLNFRELFQTARNTRSGRLEELDETYRKLIRTKIVGNIVAELPGFQQPPPRRPRYAESDEGLSDSDSESVDDYEASSAHEQTRMHFATYFDEIKYVRTVRAKSERMREKRPLQFSAHAQGKQGIPYRKLHELSTRRSN